MRGNALIEVNVENDGVRTDDFDAVCAAMEAKVAKMREEKRPWAAYFEGQLREYRKNKSCEAKIREDEEAARNRLREIGKNPPAYVLRVSSVPRQPSAQRAPKES